MFETIKTDVFTRLLFWREASRNLFYDDFELDLETFWKPSWFTYRLLVAPVTKLADMVDTFFQTRKNDSLCFERGW